MPTDVKIVHTSMVIDSSNYVTVVATDDEGRLWIARSYSTYDLQHNAQWALMKQPTVLA